jgi:hypothetical protein
MPTHPHVTLACFDCKRVGSVPASNSSLPRQHLAPTGHYCLASGVSQWASSRVTWNQAGSCSARQWLGPWQFRLRLWQAQSLLLSSGLQAVFDPNNDSKKCVTYYGVTCPSIKTNIVIIWPNKVQTWVNKVKLKYKQSQDNANLSTRDTCSGD